MFLCESADPLKLNDPLNLHSFTEQFASIVYDCTFFDV